LSHHKIYVKNFNDNFLILEEDSDKPSGIIPQVGEIIFNEKLTFIDEVIVTEKEVCLKLNQYFTNKTIYTLINICDKKMFQKEKIASKSKTYKLPVCFELAPKSDWELIVKNCKMTKDTYISELVSIKFDIAMYGFLPGFLYMNGLPGHLHCKRKSSPTKTIDPNSLAVGSQYLGLYSIPSPAGWNIIGTSAFNVMNIPNTPPNLLNIGDSVKLSRISKDRMLELKSTDQTILTYNA